MHLQKLQDNSLTLLSIIKDNPVSLKSQCKVNENDIRAAIMLIIDKEQKLVNDYKRPEANVIIASVDLILSDYSHFGIDDVQLFFKRIFGGFYGEIIGAVDFMIIGAKLKEYSNEKQQTAISYAGQTSKHFPKKNYEPVPMPLEVKQILKEKIGYDPKSKDEKKPAYKVDWRKKLPGLDETTYQIWDWFDEQWYKQGCPLLPGSKEITAIIEYNEVNYTRGEFTKMAKQLSNGE